MTRAIITAPNTDPTTVAGVFTTTVAGVLQQRLQVCLHRMMHCDPRRSLEKRLNNDLVVPRVDIAVSSVVYILLVVTIFENRYI